ncbi:MAG: hypothetical protein VCC04_08020 [Myxococcota bacterium]
MKRLGSEGVVRPRRSTSLAQVLGLWVLFSVLGLLVYGPALDGEFISDDSHYVASNEYVHTPSLANIVAIWDPRSEVTVLVENYAPVHLMLHSMEWQFFGPSVRGYHVVNIWLHGLAAAMLVVVYRRSGISLLAATAGSAFFLLHPANVESVAWISQLKSSSALVLSLGALLLHPRHPASALILFGLALFAKPFAAFALVVVGLFAWMRSTSAARDGEISPHGDPHWKWLFAWLAIVVAYAGMESSAFSQSAALAPPLYADPWVRILMIFSVALRYGWMTLSGRGLSAFHEPLPTSGLLDPWVLGGVVLLLGLVAWMGLALSKRREEGVYLAWAAISFAPLSGVVPLPYPMADRYLYFILPGLIGALILGATRLGRGLVDRWGLGEPWRPRFRVVLIVIAALVLIQAGQLTHARSRVFQSADALMLDAERNYPDGAAANTRKASRAASRGDFEGAVYYLRAARGRGYNRVDHLLQDPAYAPMQEHPGFLELKHEMADDWILRLSRQPDLHHYSARALAQAYIVKDDLSAAAAVLEAASARPGPIGQALLDDVERIRAQIAFRERLEAVRSRGRKSPR